MIDLQSSFCGVMSADFISVLRECFDGDAQIEQLKRKRQIRYLEHYLRNLDAETVVIEKNYIDHDYLEDYASYYARCFTSYPRACVRLHFFSISLSDARVRKFIVTNSTSEFKDVIDSYLGFVILKPLSETVIGRTCLKPCVNVKCNRGNSITKIDYKALCEVEVSFFGQQLKVKCMPFMEQDKIISTCAICSLWSALYVSSNLFGHSVLSAARIAIKAKEHGASLRRAIPNRYGLLANEMAYVIRSIGLDVVAVDLKHMIDVWRKNSLVGNVYAYLNAGIPVLLLGEFIGSRGLPGSKHAFVVNGYKCKKTNWNVLPKERLYASAVVDELIVNDDCIGPYASMKIPFDRKYILRPKSGGMTTNKLLSFADISKNRGWIRVSFDMVTNWRQKGEKERDFRVLYLIIPIYDKIRVNYEEIWGMAYPFEGMVKRFMREIDMTWRIKLVKGGDFKNYIRKMSDICEEDRMDLLVKSLPKYMWEVAVLIDNVVNAMFYVDATDAGPGLKIIISLFIFKDMLRISKVLSNKGCFKERPNLICDVCEEALNQPYAQQKFCFS